MNKIDWRPYDHALEDLNTFFMAYGTGEEIFNVQHLFMQLKDIALQIQERIEPLQTENEPFAT